MKIRNGISLIVLVIIIIIMSVLAGSVIMNMKDTKITTSAMELKIKANTSSIKEELQNYISHQETEYARQGLIYSREKLNANESIATYGEENIGTIKDILPSISKSGYDGAFEIINGYLVLTGNYDFTNEEEVWIEEIINN